MEWETSPERVKAEPPKIRNDEGTAGSRCAEQFSGSAATKRDPASAMGNGDRNMTIFKSVLLGSAAVLVTVAAAQAADLPTHKAAPVAQYVKICDVGGVTGWTLPGSDTCFKISGYITAQFTGGNLSSQYNWGGSVTSAIAKAADPFAISHTSQVLLVQGGDTTQPIYNAITGKPVLSGGTQLILPNQQNATFNRPETGYSTRANVTFDAASNTAYGPLLAHIEVQTESASGFDPLGNNSYLNVGYLTWAGITAGKAPSFYSFTGGGDNWANFFSPDRKGFNQPNVFAYTASFGGGFSATISAESQFSSSGGGTNLTGAVGSNPGAITFGGTRWPDIVGALHVKQGWGEAQLSGVIHNVNVRDYTFYGADGCGTFILTACNGSESKVGWAIDAGVKFNLPWFPGDTLLLTGAYSQNAVWYSGLVDGMWGENGQVNGNGQPMYLADAYFNPLTNSWSAPKAWSVSVLFEHHWTPTFYTDFEGSIGQIKWDGNDGYSCTGPGACFGTGVLSPKATSWIVGADFGWNPVTNLNFDFEAMYQGTTQDRPSAIVGTVYNSGAFVPGAWEGNSNGFAGRLRVTRYF
jgi:hypothetical protein